MMKQNKFIEIKILIYLSILLLIISSCRYSAKKQEKTVADIREKPDTIIIKHQNILDDPFNKIIYSKSFSYYWITGKDTLDFTIDIYEWKKRGNLYIRLSHKKPITLAVALKKINDSFPLIEEDFDLLKIQSINFQEPIFYFDIAQELANKYEKEFGRKNIQQKRLNQFLLKSTLTCQLNDFLNPINKKVKSYGFEKFFLKEKENYKAYLPPNFELTEYPEFTFNAHSGMIVELEDK